MTPHGDTQTPNLSENTPAFVENRFHTYVSNCIPWYVRLIWLCFWIFAVYYVISYLFPDLQTEIFDPQ